MKKLKLIFTACTLALLALSCTNDGGSSVQALNKGAVPNILKATNSDTSINLVSVNNGLNVNLGLTISIAQGDVISYDIVGFYQKNGAVEKAVLKGNVTTFPYTYNFNQTDLINAFTSLNTVSDFTQSDKLIVSVDMTLANGTIVKIFNSDGTPNYGADISNSQSFKVSQAYVMACPLSSASNFNGNYKVVEDGWADYAVGDIVPVVYNSSYGTYTFRILNTSRPFILNGSTTYLIVTIHPADATVTVTSNDIWDYGGGFTTTVTGDGTVSSCTGAINLSLDFSGSSQNQPFTLIKK